jgi:hypothetical protein
VLNVIAPFYAEWHTADRIAPEEAASDTHAPLVASALVLKARPLFALVFTVWAFKYHRPPLSEQSWNPDKLPLLL